MEKERIEKEKIEKEKIEKEMEFVKNKPLFSFLLNGIDAWELQYDVTSSKQENTTTTVYQFSGGIKITNVCKSYDRYGACEWVNFIENISDSPSGILSDLWDCDCTLPLEYEENRKWQAFFPDIRTATKVYAPSGSTWTKEEFYSNIDEIRDNHRVNHIYPGETKEYSASGGRSSEKNAPFFNINKKEKGYIFAIGWTGQWKCQITRSNQDITFRSKVEDTHFQLMPGEKIRTSSVVIMPYDGGVINAHNKWRRFLKEHFSLIGLPGRDSYGPLCAGIWGGMKSESVLKRINLIKENQLPIEYIWMDAGWYGADTKATPDEFEGDWPKHTGDWRVSPLIHPQGLKDVSKAIHDAGMKFILWFEPERVINTTPMALEHPEYFLSNGQEGNHNLLLNLGNPKAWEYCFHTLSGFIEELNIDCYRQDFNFSPLSYWRMNDTESRSGITEIKHINGLYKLWDALLEKFPGLIIDNCASGGRRIDIETLRRSIPLWRSDYQCPANYDIEASQCHNQTYNLWMPYSGTGSGREYDAYRIRSSYAGAMTTNYFFSDRDSLYKIEENIEFIKKYSNEYRKIRPFFYENFYPLTELSDQLDTWCAMQFHRPDHNDGMVMLFRRENAPYEMARFILNELEIDRDYQFEDMDGGTFVVSGKELKDIGFTANLPNKKMAKIFLYIILV